MSRYDPTDAEIADARASLDRQMKPYAERRDLYDIATVVAIENVRSCLDRVVTARVEEGRAIEIRHARAMLAARDQWTMEHLSSAAREEAGS